MKKMQIRKPLSLTAVILALTTLISSGGCGSDMGNEPKSDHTESSVTTGTAQQSGSSSGSEKQAGTAESTDNDSVSSDTEAKSLEKDFVNNEDFYGLLSAEYVASGSISTDINDYVSLHGVHTGRVLGETCNDLIVYDGRDTYSKDVVLINLKTKSGVSLLKQSGCKPLEVRDYAVSKDHAYLSTTNGVIYAFDANGNMVNSIDTGLIQLVWAGDGFTVYGQGMGEIYLADETLSNSEIINLPVNGELKAVIGTYGADTMAIQYETGEFKTVRGFYNMKTMDFHEIKEDIVYSYLLHTSIGKYALLSQLTVESNDTSTTYGYVLNTEENKFVSKFHIDDIDFYHTYFGGDSNVIYNPDTSTWERVKYSADGSKNVIAELGKHEIPKDKKYHSIPYEEEVFLTQISDKCYLASQGQSIYLCTYEGGADSAELIYRFSE